MFFKKKIETYSVSTKNTFFIFSIYGTISFIISVKSYWYLLNAWCNQWFFSKINVNSFWNASKTCRLTIFITLSLFEFGKKELSPLTDQFQMCITRTVYKCWDYRVTAVSVTRRIFWTGQLPPSSQDMAQDKNHGQNFTTDLKH